MKNVIAVACSLVVLSISGVYAHPPSALNIKVDGEKVTINSLHAVSSPEVHFISEIAIWVNDTKTVTQKFIRQNGESQVVSYDIPGIKKGDKIKVRSVCNKFGDLTKEVTVN